MKAKIEIILLFILATACNSAPGNKEMTSAKPESFLAHMIPENLLAHAGVFSNDQSDYYFTLSDAEFKSFTIMHSKWVEDRWSAPDTAFFNSDFLEHGVHFSPDNQWLYFSSTRPVGIDSIPNTWHIWRCPKTESSWGTPEYVPIPGLSQKLISHPSTDKNGRIYFHSGNTDYSELALYFADQTDGKFETAKRLYFSGVPNQNCITPFISPDGSYLLFAQIVENGYELNISYPENESWYDPIKLNDAVNAENLGNPYVTPDGKYLYYACGDRSANGIPAKWIIKKIETATILP